MKTTLAHLSKAKKDELKKIVKTLFKIKEVEMIILFGSYARGYYKEGADLNPYRKSGYVSDCDVATKEKSTAADIGFWGKIAEHDSALSGIFPKENKRRRYPI